MCGTRPWSPKLTHKRRNTSLESYAHAQTPALSHYQVTGAKYKDVVSELISPDQLQSMYGGLSSAALGDAMGPWQKLMAVAKPDTVAAR